MLGTLGDLTFTVSSNRIFTYKDLSIKSSVRMAQHDSLQTKPTLEFIGEGLDELQVKLDLRIEDKVNPYSEFLKIKEKMTKGEELTFFIGDKKIGKFVIADIGHSYRRIDNKGNILAMDLDLNLKEVAPKPKAETKVVKADKKEVGKKIAQNLVKKAVTKKPVAAAMLMPLKPIADVTQKYLGIKPPRIVRPKRKGGRKK